MNSRPDSADFIAAVLVTFDSVKPRDPSRTGGLPRTIHFCTDWVNRTILTFRPYREIRSFFRGTRNFRERSGRTPLGSVDMRSHFSQPHRWDRLVRGNFSVRDSASQFRDILVQEIMIPGG